MKRFTPAWLAVCLACSFSTSSLAADALATRAFQGMPADFIKGADISTLLDAEKHGATFYDQNNQRKDPIAILKENGVNYVRLRLWVDPQSASGEDYGGGNNDLATTLALAKRAKAQGMKLLLDFHYSDFWTDPGKQFKPKAWEKLGAGRRRVRPAGWPAERGYRWPEGEPAPGRAGENHAASGRRDQERYLPLVV